MSFSLIFIYMYISFSVLAGLHSFLSFSRVLLSTTALPRLYFISHIFFSLSSSSSFSPLYSSDYLSDAVCTFVRCLVLLFSLLLIDTLFFVMYLFLFVCLLLCFFACLFVCVFSPLSLSSVSSFSSFSSDNIIPLQSKKSATQNRTVEAAHRLYEESQRLADRLASLSPPKARGAFDHGLARRASYRSETSEEGSSKERRTKREKKKKKAFSASLDLHSAFSPVIGDETAHRAAADVLSQSMQQVDCCSDKRFLFFAFSPFFFPFLPCPLSFFLPRFAFSVFFFFLRW